MENGRQALEAYLNTPDTYDAILLDLRMPVMDSFEAVAISAAAKEKVPEPFLCFVYPAVRMKCGQKARAGFSAVLTKPINGTAAGPAGLKAVPEQLGQPVRPELWDWSCRTGAVGLELWELEL